MPDLIPTFGALAQFWVNKIYFVFTC